MGCYRNILDKDAKFAPAANNLAYLLAEYYPTQENLAKALGLAEKAASLHPDNPFIADTLGWVKYRLGKSDEAIIHFTKALEAKPEEPIFHYHLGAALYEKGDQQKARGALQAALRKAETSANWLSDAKKLMNLLEQ